MIEGVVPADEDIVESAEDPGLPLRELDRGIAPIRRVVSFAVDRPGNVSYFESNIRRWLDPLLALELPEPLREQLVTLAGQLAGFDALDAAGRLARLHRIRQLVIRLDALLGLPLPEKERRSPRKHGGRNSSQDGSARTRGADDADGADDATQRSRSRRSRKSKRGRDRSDGASDPTDPAGSEDSGDALLSDDLDAMLEVAEDSEPREPRGRRFWNGNPYVAIDDLEIEDDLANALKDAGIEIVRDLLLRPPVSVESYRPIHGAGRALPEGRIAVGGRLKSTWTVCRPDGSRSIHARLHGAGPLTLAWEDERTARWWLESVAIDDRMVVVGTWNGENLEDPEVVFDSGKSVRLPRFGLEGVPDARVQALLFRLMPMVRHLRDPVSGAVRGSQVALHEAVESLHGRGDPEVGRTRMAFDEALVVGIAAGWDRFGANKVRGIQHAIVHSKLDRLLSAADVRLDDEQQLAFDEIKRDLRRSRPMRRVLMGGPGGGKGLVALLTAVLVAESKCQVLWVSSDAQLAETRFAACEPLLREAGVVARIVTGAPNGALRDALKRGEVHILFGTPELVGADLEFRRLGLVVSSEAKGFGEVSAAVDALKAPRPDLLVVPVVPPTVTALLTGWADHEITIVVGPEPPDVVVKSSANRVSAYAPARHTLMGGGQVAVLFPQIGGKDALEPGEAHRVVSALGAEALSGARIALVHSAMPRDERQRVVSDFSHRRADALVATLPLEDGPPVPGLQIAVVEQAHRMEPARLRRIAGMGVKQVVLVVDEGTSEERSTELHTVVRDHRSLPAGEPSEAAPRFRFLDPARDASILLQGRNLALDLMAADPGLRNGQNADLVRAALVAWPQLFGDRPCPLPEPTDSGSGGKRRRRRRRRK
ncbi:MAG: hypothetical protein R3F61_37195 [Myxococcota bacterium]